MHGVRLNCGGDFQQLHIGSIGAAMDLQQTLTGPT
jgi:hypothetical protein